MRSFIYFCCIGTHAHLKELLRVAATCYRSKAEKPIAEILHILEDVDLHPICLHIELKHKIRADDSGARVGAKLKIAHVHATARTPQRPSIVLSPGKYSSSLSVYTDSFACHTCDIHIYTKQVWTFF